MKTKVHTNREEAVYNGLRDALLKANLIKANGAIQKSNRGRVYVRK